MDWQQFNEDMNNMAQTMQQMMPQSMMSFNQPPMFHQASQPPVMHQMAPSMQTQTFINIQQQQQQQPQDQMQSFVNQMQNFAQGMVNYSQQMVRYSQTISNQMMQQHQPQNNHQNNNSASIVLMDPQIQQFQHSMQQINNPFQSQPMFAHNNIQNHQNQNNNNNNVIDLTGNDEADDDEEEEEEKEEFVPWQDNDIPNEFKCPISLEIMSDPVICSDGFWYQRDCILDWLKNHNRSPMTNLEMQNPSIHSDQTLKTKIKEWIRAQWTKYGQSDDQEYDNMDNDDFEMDSTDDEVYDEEEEEEEFDQECMIRKL